MKTLKVPFVLNEKQFKIYSYSALMILFIVSLFTFGKAYNGVLLYLKLALYFQLLIVLVLQFIAVMALKKYLIKFISLGGMCLLFVSTFYLDNFFYGSTAGSFLRIFIIYSILQILLISFDFNVKKES